MFRLALFSFLFFLLSCKSTTYFIVRHAEREQGSAMMSDPPLSAEGEKQALGLQRFLQNKNIKSIYSTNYARTIATAEPLRKQLGITLKIYDPRKMELLLGELKKTSDGNVLVVGHSNTVDDVVNGLLGQSKMTDLPDTAYGNVFIVKRKGGSYSFEQVRVPK